MNTQNNNPNLEAIVWNGLTEEEKARVLSRPGQAHNAQCKRRVAEIIAAVPVVVETAPGVCCETLYRPIQRVGLYVPAGSAPLPSTVLMLAIPARIAGCPRIVLVTPPNAEGLADPVVLAAAALCGVDTVFVAGGAHAIAALAYGTESIPKVDKIYGPGNAWVTEAKTQVAMDSAGAAIDMPAGPSEVLVVADGSVPARRRSRPSWRDNWFALGEPRLPGRHWPMRA